MSHRPLARRPGPAALAAATLTFAGLAGLTLCGCGGSTSRGARISGGRLVVYTGLPLLGPTAASGRAVLRGERMALAAVHGRVGRYRIVLRALDDATRASRGWNPGQTDTIATHAARDDRTIGYIGDLNSGASAVSLPILNRAHIPQVSPLATAVGLTRAGPEASPGEPERYYPARTRTFARVVPSDLVQSAVQARIQRAAGCDRVMVLYDAEFDGRDGASSYEVAARRAGLRIIGAEQVDTNPAGLRSLAARLEQLEPDCVLLSALDQDGAAALADTTVEAVPSALVFVTASAAEPGFVSSRGGVEVGDDSQLTITSPTLGYRDYPPAGRRFLRAFDRRYGSGAMQGIWGEAAMSLLLDAIRRAGDGGRHDVTRARVMRAILTTRDEHSVLGTYSITRSGDTTLRRYGVYHVAGGHLVFWRAVRG
ncbi:MAG TPA: ABC transporter substrate-binding protein [Solirubrobacteraceae bacterium]|nr:ABC transporter substrate-binding protein [Solirubrobacteraceae bacterium]